MSSKWNRPMRRFQPVRLSCQRCGQPIQPGEFGGWEHIQRMKVRDPQWHRAEA